MFLPLLELKINIHCYFCCYFIYICPSIIADSNGSRMGGIERRKVANNNQIFESNKGAKMTYHWYKTVWSNSTIIVCK